MQFVCSLRDHEQPLCPTYGLGYGGGNWGEKTIDEST